MTLARHWHTSALDQDPVTEDAKLRRRQRARSLFPGHVCASPVMIDDPAQEPARSFGSVQNRWTSSGESLVCEQLRYAYTMCQTALHGAMMA